jgi:Family of unknown function (DUF5372)
VTAGLPGMVVITRPGHPLAGRELRVLGGMRRHGVRELLVMLPDGSKRLIPAAWTDAAPASSQDGVGAAATLGAVSDLLAACVLVRGLSARRPGQEGQAARQSPVKEDNRAACPAQSAAGTVSGATPDGVPSAPPTPGHRRGHAAGRPDREGGSSGRRAGHSPAGGERR